jgi:tetratricopeptide (TPR) repeat protein
MATKEVMVTAPLLVLLYDRTFVAGQFSAAFRQRGRYYASLAAAWLVLGWLLIESHGARGTAAGFGLGISSWSYLLTQAEAIVRYIKLSVWPHPLIFDYGTSTARSFVEVWWQALLVISLLVASAWALRRKPAFGFLGAAFFLLLAPSSSVVPLVTQTVAEHRMYLPLAAIVVLAPIIGRHALGRGGRPVLIALTIVLGCVTIARNHDYGTAAAIWSDTVAKIPTNPRAHNNLASSLQQQGAPKEADVHFARAVALDPDYFSARYNWGVALLDQGRVSAAITQLEAAVRLAPDHADALVNLGSALVRAQRASDAIPRFEAALRIAPGADVHYDLGIALLDAGRTDAAAGHFRSALQINAQLSEAHFQLGRLAERAGRITEAEEHYNATLRLAPSHAAAHSKLGLLLARTERLEAAAEHFRAVVRLQPKDADAHANLGNVLLLQSQPRAALASYEEALRLRPDDPRTRENIQLAREALH